MSLQIFSRAAQALGVVLEAAKAVVATGAEKAAHAPSVVAMVHRKWLHVAASYQRLGFMADGAHTTLGHEQEVIGFQGNLVGDLKIPPLLVLRPFFLSKGVPPPCRVSCIGRPSLFWGLFGARHYDKVLDSIVFWVRWVWFEVWGWLAAVDIYPNGTGESYRSVPGYIDIPTTLLAGSGVVSGDIANLQFPLISLTDIAPTENKGMGWIVRIAAAQFVAELQYRFNIRHLSTRRLP